MLQNRCLITRSWPRGNGWGLHILRGAGPRGRRAHPLPSLPRLGNALQGALSPSPKAKRLRGSIHVNREASPGSAGRPRRSGSSRRWGLPAPRPLSPRRGRRSAPAAAPGKPRPPDPRAAPPAPPAPRHSGSGRSRVAVGGGSRVWHRSRKALFWRSASPLSCRPTCCRRGGKATFSARLFFWAPQACLGGAARGCRALPTDVSGCSDSGRALRLGSVYRCERVWNSRDRRLKEEELEERSSCVGFSFLLAQPSWMVALLSCGHITQRKRLDYFFPWLVFVVIIVQKEPLFSQFAGPHWGSRNMLMKEYRICMPLTVEEVRAATGNAEAVPDRGASLSRRVEVVFVLLSIFSSCGERSRRWFG